MTIEARTSPGTRESDYPTRSAQYASRRMVLKAITASSAAFAIGAAIVDGETVAAADEPRLNAWVRVRADGKAVI